MNCEEGADLVLGTAQLALEYGSYNKTSPPNSWEAEKLLNYALKNKVSAIDTGRAYGKSEHLIGEALRAHPAVKTKVITKLSPLDELSLEDSAKSAIDATNQSIFCSLNELQPFTPIILLHRFDHLHAWGGVVWERLLEIHREGLIAGLGVSVQSIKEASEVMSLSQVQMVQLPLNLLDWRWRSSDFLSLLQRRNDIVIHARSVFLQGSLLKDPENWLPLQEKSFLEIPFIVRELTAQLNRESVADLCISYVRSKPWVNGVVIGMERLNQLKENLKLFSKPPLSLKESDFVESALPMLPERILNPSLWNF